MKKFYNHPMNHNAEPELPVVDVRKMIRLLGEVAAHQGSEAQRKRFLMDELCRMVGCDSWAWVLIAEMVPGKLPVYVGFQHGGFSEEQLNRYLEIHAHPDMAWISEPWASDIARMESTVTRTLAQIVPEAQFEQSNVARLWAEVGVKPRLLCAVPIGGGGHSGIGMYRPYQSKPFTEREARMVHIVMSEVQWLHQLSWPEDKAVDVPRMSPRQRMVLERLLQGSKREEIAAQMQLRLNTVNGYVREIFKTLGVHSHAELLARFYCGDGGHLKSAKAQSMSAKRAALPEDRAAHPIPLKLDLLTPTNGAHSQTNESDE